MTKANRFAGLGLKRDDDGAGERAPRAKRSATKTPPQKKAKRATGKSADLENFKKTSLYLPKDLHRDVKSALLYQPEHQDMSELGAELFAKWLKSHKPNA